MRANIIGHDRDGQMTRHEENDRFVRIAVGITAAALSLGILALVGHQFGLLVSQTLAVAISIAMLVAMLYCLATHQQRREQARRQREQFWRRCTRQQPKPHTPADFNDRLANFLHRPPDEVEELGDNVAEPAPRYQSKMPFWCRAQVFTRFGPKPTERIRQLLHRIRQAVHGRRNGHG
jgi:hypothetical protein